MADASNEQIFQEVVALAESLKERGKLAAGAQFFINEAGQISAKPVEPDAEAMKKFGTLDLPALARNALELIQQVRYSLSQAADLNSAAWNASPAGRALNTMESVVRKETCRMEDYHAGKTTNLYNMARFSFMHLSLYDLGQLLASEDFQSCWQRGKVKALNQWALEFERRDYYSKVFDQICTIAEMAIAVNQAKIRGQHDVSAMVASMGNTEILEKLKIISGKDDHSAEQPHRRPLPAQPARGQFPHA